MCSMTLQASTEVIEPQHKKGRKGSRQASGVVPALRPGDCIQAVFIVAQGVLAMGGDAARLLQWGSSTPAAAATLSLAIAMLKWAKYLHEVSPGWFSDVKQVLRLDLLVIGLLYTAMSGLPASDAKIRKIK